MKRSLAALILTALVAASATQAADKPPALTTAVQAAQAGQIPAGSAANLLVVLSGSNAPMARENQPVALPVAGKLAGTDLPANTVLVGVFRRIDAKSGAFHFDRLVLGTRVYEVEITSDPLPGKLVADSEALQAMMGDVQKEIAEMTAQQIEAMQRQQAASTGVGLLGGVLGMLPGVGLASGLVEGALSQATTSGTMDQAGAMSRKLADVYAKVPKVLYTRIEPLQKLALHLRRAVDLAAPAAILPAPMQQQGLVAPPDAALSGLDLSPEPTDSI